eukprot:gene6865-7401_t
MVPSLAPSDSPSFAPTALSIYPISPPTGQPSSHPSIQSSSSPSAKPSPLPTSKPSSRPIERPSSQPTAVPSVKPFSLPSLSPIIQGRAFDVEAQNILLKAATSSALRDGDNNKKEDSVSAPQLGNRNDVCPAISKLSSSFLSSTSLVTKGGDNDEIDVQKNKHSKKKKREELSPSLSMNIEEGFNEELSDSIIELESLSVSKEVDKLLLVNEAIDDALIESDDSIYSMFSEVSDQN